MQYMLKINLGIGIVCMVNNTALKNIIQVESNTTFLLINNYNISINESNSLSDQSLCLIKTKVGGKSLVWKK